MVLKFLQASQRWLLKTMGSILSLILSWATNKCVSPFMYHLHLAYIKKLIWGQITPMQKHKNLEGLQSKRYFFHKKKGAKIKVQQEQ